jgi:predicted DsbA family dithiol-disulfide isomerase
MAAAAVTVFSDFTCPFSYVTEAALWRLEDEGAAEVKYRAFELFPAPSRLPLAGGEGWPDALRPLARELGLEMGNPSPPARTRKAHEAARFAASRGVGRQMREAIYRAHFGGGRDVGRIDVLVALGTALGLDATETKVVLDVDTFTADVEADEAEARRLGIVAVPALVVGSGTAARMLLGAQPLHALRTALAQAEDGGHNGPGAAPDPS